jgi:DNA-binding Lrp family transcriptional regulator
MEGSKVLDVIDRNILRVLSRYEGMELVDLWYEIGEDLEINITKDEVLSRLKSLLSHGFVNRFIRDEQGTHWTLKK